MSTKTLQWRSLRKAKRRISRFTVREATRARSRLSCARPIESERPGQSIKERAWSVPSTPKVGLGSPPATPPEARPGGELLADLMKMADASCQEWVSVFVAEVFQDVSRESSSACKEIMVSASFLQAGLHASARHLTTEQVDKSGPETLQNRYFL